MAHLRALRARCAFVSASPYTNKGANTNVIVANNLISTCKLGPAVSLNGSPTVSPTTAALCASDLFPPYCPVSINFFALSHAPPPLFINIASSTPEIVPTINNPATDSAPDKFTGTPEIVGTSDLPAESNAALAWYAELKFRKIKPTATGNPTASTPGNTISFNAAPVTIPTHRA